MTHSFDVSALGLRIRVLFDSAASGQLLQRATDAWSDALLPSFGEPDAEVSVPSEGDEESLLERLSVDVTLAALHRRRGSMLMFHAAGIAAPDGRVVAFVGPSGRGKTTITRVLAQRYGYVSDETVAVDEERGVFPYRKPLSLVRDGQPKRQVAASSIGLQALPESELRLVALVVLDRVDRQVEPRVERVRLVDVLDEIVAQMSYLPELDRPLQRVADLAQSLGGLMRLTYTEASSVLPVVEEVLDGRIPRSDEAVVRPSLPVRESESAIGIGEVDDAIDDGEAVLVLADRTVRVLGGIAPEIWRGVVAGLSREEIGDAVVGRDGEPPDGDIGELVDAAIDDLIAAGLLVGSATAQEAPSR